MPDWIDPTIDVGTILAIVVAVGGMIWKLKDWLKTNVLNRIEVLEDMIFEVDADGRRISRLKQIEQDVGKIRQIIDRRNWEQD